MTNRLVYLAKEFNFTQIPRCLAILFVTDTGPRSLALTHLMTSSINTWLTNNPIKKSMQPYTYTHTLKHIGRYLLKRCTCLHNDVGMVNCENVSFQKLSQRARKPVEPPHRVKKFFEKRLGCPTADFNKNVIRGHRTGTAKSSFLAFAFLLSPDLWRGQFHSKPESCHWQLM